MNNKEISKIFTEDQDDRKNPDFFKNPKYLKRDADRAERILKIFISKKIITPLDYYRSAFVLHHSSLDTDREVACQLAKKSFGMGYNKAGWLYAAIVDRNLMQSGKKQRFGTQFFRQSSDMPFEIYPSLSVAKKIREKYGLKSKEKVLEDLAKLNRKFYRPS